MKKILENLKSRFLTAAKSTQTVQEKAVVGRQVGQVGQGKPSGQEIDGVDIEEGKTRFAGNFKTYLRVLKSFSENTGALVEKIRTPAKDNLSDYATTVHGIKGSCYGISAKVCGDLALELELASKACDFETVAAKNGKFIEKLEDTIERIKAFVAAKESEMLAAGGGRPKKKEPDKEILLKIMQGAENFDNDQICAGVEELEKFDYETNAEFFEEVKKLARNFDYGGLYVKLKEM